MPTKIGTLDPRLGRRSLRLLRSLMPLQKELSLLQLLTLLQIAVEPGLSVNELSERLSLPQQTASRHVAALLGRYQGGPSGLETSTRTTLDPLIIQEISPTDPRSRALFISEEGLTLLKRVMNEIDK